MFDEEKSTSVEIPASNKSAEPSFTTSSAQGYGRSKKATKGEPTFAHPGRATAGEPEDIFAETERDEFRLSPETISRLEKKSPATKKVVIIIVGILVIGGLVYGAYWGYGKMQDSKIKQEEILTPNIKDIIDNKKEIEIKESILPGDADGDGLSDQEEINLGANPNIVDTDGDGLADYEEVKIYQTNPLNPDTDGDGYLDGQEVRGGYNPKGSGKLGEPINLNF